MSSDARSPLVFEDLDAFLVVAQQAMGLNFDTPEDDELLMALVEAMMVLAGRRTAPDDTVYVAIKRAARLRKLETQKR